MECITRWWVRVQNIDERREMREAFGGCSSFNWVWPVYLVIICGHKALCMLDLASRIDVQEMMIKIMRSEVHSSGLHLAG